MLYHGTALEYLASCTAYQQYFSERQTHKSTWLDLFEEPVRALTRAAALALKPVFHPPRFQKSRLLILVADTSEISDILSPAKPNEDAADWYSPYLPIGSYVICDGLSDPGQLCTIEDVKLIETAASLLVSLTPLDRQQHSIRRLRYFGIHYEPS